MICLSASCIRYGPYKQEETLSVHMSATIHFLDFAIVKIIEEVLEPLSVAHCADADEFGLR